jgi:hypothetical protein
MWRPLFRQEHLKPGDRLRKELLVGEGSLWTEYEVIEAGDCGLVLKPLVSNGNVHADKPMTYKKMAYDTLYAGNTRIWVTFEKPVAHLLVKEELYTESSPERIVQGERLTFTFLGLRLKLANPDRLSIVILIVVLLFFLLFIVQVLLH